MVGCYGGERASTGECPAGEVCSSQTPNGLHFIGKTLVDDILLTGPAPTAVGGTQEVALQYDRGDGILIALDLAYTADDDGGLGVRVDHTSGSVVTMRGAGSRTNYLRILDAADGTLFDRKELTGAALDQIQLIPADGETVPATMQLAWATGEQLVGIALLGQVQESTGPVDERIVDTSMQVAAAGADRMAWDLLHYANLTEGTQVMSVTAGDKPAASLDLVVVAGADAMQPIDPPATIAANGTAEVCFAATAAGRFVVGLPWTFHVDGVAQTSSTNCVLAQTTKTTGTVSVQASAGGQQASVTLNVGAMARTAPERALRVIPTAGDRAALRE